VLTISPALSCAAQRWEAPPFVSISLLQARKPVAVFLVIATARQIATMQVPATSRCSESLMAGFVLAHAAAFSGSQGFGRRAQQGTETVYDFVRDSQSQSAGRLVALTIRF
jgi:hypothetical protein